MGLLDTENVHVQVQPVGIQPPPHYYLKGKKVCVKIMTNKLFGVIIIFVTVISCTFILQQHPVENLQLNDNDEGNGEVQLAGVTSWRIIPNLIRETKACSQTSIKVLQQLYWIKDLTHEERLSSLGKYSLEFRRLRGDLIEVLHIKLKSKTTMWGSIPQPLMLSPSTHQFPPSVTARRGHNLNNPGFSSHYVSINRRAFLICTFNYNYEGRRILSVLVGCLLILKSLHLQFVHLIFVVFNGFKIVHSALPQGGDGAVIQKKCKLCFTTPLLLCSTAASLADTCHSLHPLLAFPLCQAHHPNNLHCTQ
ncbi:uncharacterized protein [Scyliorhinus torazame]|uniref:uncharacterized protein n=1 Tax=Scyliorhinus torazame TaxID=75743 RepID=UPI003B598D49